MREPAVSRVLVLSRDPSVPEALRELVAGAGVEVCEDREGAVPAGPWSVVCVDEALGAAVAAVGAGDAPVLWLSREVRGEATAGALADGAADVLALPLWPAEARARLGRWLSLDPGPPGPRCEEELGLLLELQRELIPLQVPSQIVARVRVGLQRLFPGATVEIGERAGDGGARSAEAAEAGQGPWRRAVVALASGGGRQGEVRVAAPPGATYPVEKRRLLEAYADQVAQGLHRTRLYEALSVGKDEWEQTFDTIPDSIAILDRDRRVRRVNRALAESVGLPPREMVGGRCHRVLHGRDEPCDPCPVEAVFESGEAGRWPRQVQRAGRVYDYRAFPLLDDAGGVRAVITYGRDVTREEQLAQGLRHSEKLMTLGQIAAGIAHEINNPLTAVSSYAQLLGMEAQGPKGAESARRIQNGVERIHRLVQNLMSFARPADDVFYPLDLNEIVAKTLSFSRYEVTRGDTRLEQVLGAGLPRVLGSEAQLEQLFVNLLTNARDAVGGRGTVRVTTAVDDERVCLTVSDDGVGFDPTRTEQLFEPFYTTKPVGQGTGLGLFIAAGIAEKHRGSLQLRSRPGRGTEACLSLPAFT